MASGRDRRRSDIARFLEAVDGFRAPEGTPEERAVWVILARHGTKEGATRALEALRDRYVDINEFRVAKVTESADLIEPHVKNDAFAVAAHARNWLRRFFTDHHHMDLGAVDPLTPDGLKKYVAGLEEYASEIALALLFRYCAVELEPEEPAEEADARKKRPERDLTAAANRLRLVFSVAAQGVKGARNKTLPTTRKLHSAWAYRALPKPPAPKKAAKVSKKKAAKKTAAKKTATKKTATKKKTTRAAGKSVPRTSRARPRAPAKKKSSRRG